ncbi:MAG: hypothetical protein LKG01_06090 [Bifidobacterium subtile]|nr:hypothetical protein [Bifidobacterium subtile]
MSQHRMGARPPVHTGTGESGSECAERLDENHYPVFVQPNNHDSTRSPCEAHHW